MIAAALAALAGWWLASRLAPAPLRLRLAAVRRAVPAARNARWREFIAGVAARARGRAAVEAQVAAAGWPAAAVDRLLAAERILPIALPIAGLPLLWLASDGAGMVAGTALLAAVGRFGPRLLAVNAAQRRLQALARGLPDAVDLLVICADSGLGLAAALARCGRELAPAQPQLAAELALTALELGLLPQQAQAYANLARRVPLPPAIALCDLMVQTLRFGTPLAQGLRALAAENRAHRLLAAEERAARLPALLTVPMIAFILPPLFIVLVGPALVKALAG